MPPIHRLRTLAFPAGLLLLLLLASSGLTAQVDTTRIDTAAIDTVATDPVDPVTTHPRTPYSPLESSFPYGLYEHRISFDTATGNVILYEEVLGEPYGQPRTLTME